jgi:hypothetical protein
MKTITWRFYNEKGIPSLFNGFNRERFGFSRMRRTSLGAYPGAIPGSGTIPSTIPDTSPNASTDTQPGTITGTSTDQSNDIEA